uniref:Uncharacterized protein n=1 Tax=Oryza barthii TaxID=65489 RepID=A0A0D3G7L7_9ORYZ
MSGGATPCRARSGRRRRALGRIHAGQGSGGAVELRWRLSSHTASYPRRRHHLEGALSPPSSHRRFYARPRGCRSPDAGSVVKTLPGVEGPGEPSRRRSPPHPHRRPEVEGPVRSRAAAAELITISHSCAPASPSPAPRSNPLRRVRCRPSPEERRAGAGGGEEGSRRRRREEGREPA